MLIHGSASWEAAKGLGKDKGTAANSQLKAALVGLHGDDEPTSMCARRIAQCCWTSEGRRSHE